jgi:hypothetical protein
MKHEPALAGYAATVIVAGFKDIFDCFNQLLA